MLNTPRGYYRLMKYIAILLLIGFVGLAVFGVFGTHTGVQGHDGGCIAATVQGTDCPKLNSLLEYLAFHLDAYKSFSLATLGESAMSVLLLVFASLLFTGLAFFYPHLFNPPQPVFFRYRFRYSFLSPQRQQLTRWLALHENSPAAP